MPMTTIINHHDDHNEINNDDDHQPATFMEIIIMKISNHENDDQTALGVIMIMMNITHCNQNHEDHDDVTKGSHSLANWMFFYTLCKRPLTPPTPPPSLWFYTIMLWIFRHIC